MEVFPIIRQRWVLLRTYYTGQPLPDCSKGRVFTGQASRKAISSCTSLILQTSSPVANRHLCFEHGINCPPQEHTLPNMTVTAAEVPMNEDMEIWQPRAAESPLRKVEQVIGFTRQIPFVGFRKISLIGPP